MTSSEIGSKTMQKQSPGDVLLKGVLSNFVKFTGKHQCQSLFFKKVVGLRLVTFLKKDPDTCVFP